MRKLQLTFLYWLVPTLALAQHTASTTAPTATTGFTKPGRIPSIVKESDDISEMGKRLEQRVVSVLKPDKREAQPSPERVPRKHYQRTVLSPIFRTGTHLGVQLGAAASYTYHPFGASHETRPSQHYLEASFGTRGDYRFDFESSTYSHANRWVSLVDIVLRREPREFFGLNATRESDYELYREYSVAFDTELRRRHGALYIGLPFSSIIHRTRRQGQYNIADQKVAATGTVLSNPALVGVGKTSSVGTGLSFAVDTRDNRFFTRTGHYIAFTPKHHWLLGSERGRRYWELLGEYRYYTSWREHILGLHLYTHNTFGDIPFYALPALGGSFIQRGLPEGKFRNQHAAAAQLEYKFPLFWILRGAVFSSIANTFGSLDASPGRGGFHYGGGAGLRALWDKDSDLHLRFDVVYNSHDRTAVIVELKEAF